MHPSRPLGDSNYGIRSINSSFGSSVYDEAEAEEEAEEGASSSSSGSTVHLTPTTPDDTPSSPALDPSNPTGPQDQQSAPSSPSPPPAILSALPRDLTFVGVARPPASLPLAPLPLLFSSTSSPVSLSPPLSPINSYTSSSVSSSSPPALTNYLSDSVSSLGSLENDVVLEGVLDLGNSHTSSNVGRTVREVVVDELGGGSNGNLVLPMWSSTAGEEAVERELREADEAGAGGDAGKTNGSSSCQEMRIVVVAGGEQERDGLMRRLAVELGVVSSEQEEEEGGAERWGVSSGGEGEERGGRRVGISGCGNDFTSVGRLLEDIRSRHSLLARQLAPTPDSLSPKDIFDLVATGKGRGDKGWIDCCLVAVEEDSPNHSLSAARILSSFVPTLLVLLRSPAADHQPLLSPELTSILARLELVSPSLKPTTTTAGPSDRLLILDRASLSLVKPEEVDGGLPTPQPGTSSTDDSPFFAQQEGERPLISFARGVQRLFATDQGIRYLHRLAARGFMRSRAALATPAAVVIVVAPPDSRSMSSSFTSSELDYPPSNHTEPSSSSEKDEPAAPFDPLHFPYAVATLFAPTLRTLTALLLEGMVGVLSVVATSLLAGVVGEVARRLDLRGAFGRRVPSWR